MFYRSCRLRLCLNEDDRLRKSQDVSAKEFPIEVYDF